jgi:hypothetical protein
MGYTHSGQIIRVGFEIQDERNCQRFERGEEKEKRRGQKGRLKPIRIMDSGFEGFGPRVLL